MHDDPHREPEPRVISPQLAEGGRVIMAPHDTFWGAVYGALVDRFGVGWDLHHEKKD